MCVCVCVCVCVLQCKDASQREKNKTKKKELLEADANKYYLTFKLKMVFSVLFLFQNCIMAFATVSIQKHPHQYAYQQGMRHYTLL